MTKTSKRLITFLLAILITLNVYTVYLLADWVGVLKKAVIVSDIGWAEVLNTTSIKEKIDASIEEKVAHQVEKYIEERLEQRVGEQLEMEIDELLTELINLRLDELLD